MSQSRSTKSAFVVLVFAFSSTFAIADDWPQWNGPTRDGRTLENGLLARIPEEGLKLLWEMPVGLGYSGPAVVGNRVYLTDYQMASGKITNNAGSRDKLTGDERTFCFDARTGKVLWSHAYDRPYDISYPTGPRVVPTVHEGRVVCLGAEGDLICFDAFSGEVQWQRSFAKDFNAKTPLWGHSAAPLVYKDSLVCMVGGTGSLVVVLDLETGKERWRALTSEETGYCSPSMIHAGGVDQLLIWSPELIYSLNPLDGSIHWQHELKPGYGMSVLPPVHEGKWLFAGGESDVSTMFELADDRPAAEPVWNGGAKDSLTLATSAAVFSEGYLYGADISSGSLTCVRASDGERQWQTALPTTGSKRGRGGAHGSAFLIKAHRNYWILSETGDAITAELTPEGYKETGRFHVIDPLLSTVGRKVLWTYPAISNGRLFVRNDNVLKCYDIGQ